MWIIHCIDALIQVYFTLLIAGKNEMQAKLDYAMVDVNAKYLQLEEIEKNSVRTALIEERGRFCLFISCIKPFVVRTSYSLLHYYM